MNTYNQELRDKSLAVTAEEKAILTMDQSNNTGDRCFENSGIFSIEKNR